MLYVANIICLLQSRLVVVSQSRTYKQLAMTRVLSDSVYMSDRSVCVRVLVDRIGALCAEAGADACLRSLTRCVVESRARRSLPR